jgi:putative transposase
MRQEPGGQTMKLEGLRSQTSCTRRPGKSDSKPSVVSPNHLQQQFNVAVPNQAWVTDITSIRTYEG